MSKGEKRWDREFGKERVVLVRCKSLDMTSLPTAAEVALDPPVLPAFDQQLHPYRSIARVPHFAGVQCFCRHDQSIDLGQVPYYSEELKCAAAENTSWRDRVLDADPWFIFVTMICFGTLILAACYGSLAGMLGSLVACLIAHAALFSSTR